ncbi:MAG: hypothetical protein HYW10_04290 [Candidatus Omnitrophica bacterium]|nr:hypothetical protein [Candidatus Omnitrophota bacterium]
MKRFALPNLSTLSRRERLLAVGGGFLLAVVLLDRLVLGPWWRHTRHVRQEIHRLEEAIRGYQQLLSRKPLIQAEAETYREQMDVIQAGTLSVVSVLREVEALGAESGITLGEVKPLSETAGDQGQTFALEVRYQGSLQQWMHFLYLLQTSQALLAIERAVVARTEEGVDVLEGSLRLTSRALRSEQAS